MGQLQVALEKAVRQSGEAMPKYNRSSNQAIKAVQTVVEELRAAPDEGAREGLCWGSGIHTGQPSHGTTSDAAGKSGGE